MLDALEEPIQDLLQALSGLAIIADEDYLLGELRALGWDPPQGMPPAFGALATAAERIVELLGSDDFESEAVPALIEVLMRVVKAVQDLQAAPLASFPDATGAAEFWSTVARELLDALLVQYLGERHPTLAGALRLAGLIRETARPATATRPLAHVHREVRWEFIGQLVTDPKRGFQEAFDWTSAPRFDDIIAGLAALLGGLGLEARVRALSPDLLAFLGTGALDPADVDSSALDLGFMPDLDDNANFGVLLYRRSASAARGVGLTLLPYATFSGSEEIDLGERLAITLKGNADLTKGLAITLVPGAPVLFESGFIGGSALPPAEALVGVRLKPDGSGPIILFGKADTSHFAVDSVGIAAGAKTANAGRIEALVEFALDNAALAIKPGSGDADSFLASLLPADGLKATFSLSVRYSSLTGLHLGGSGGLEASFPSRIQLGPIELQSTTLALRPRGGSVDLEAGATIAAALGPLKGVVENLGVKLVLDFPADKRGNLGPVNATLGFKPPRGVGLSLDLAVIKGGGYLFLDPERGEYAGALEFTLAEIVAVKAIGLVTTRMPDGSEGFSLLLILTAEFSPGLQLGFGFTLAGVGGLVGLHRAMAFEPILVGVKTGAITSVVFPQDVVANAPRILSDLKQFFPIRRDTFLVGPMVKIGWGTPTLISVSMGVIIEIPGNLALLGVMQLALPDRKAPLIQLNVAFAGGIDFAGKRIFFVAGLFDSRVLTMSLEGGLGFYIGWGDDPVFVLTVGGFHPRFAPPALPFPAPDRLALSILSTPVARIRVEAYFAVTSNTAQFGARVDLYFGLGPCEVTGYLGLDALFQFQPFYFIVEVAGGCSLKVFGAGLFSVRLHLTLEGMTPWRARGEGSITILFWDVSANFDETWGDRVPAIERFVDLLPMLQAEIAKADNWRQALPAGLNLLVTLRPLEAGAGDLVMHPLGSLDFSQRALPLERTLDKVGEQTPRDARRLSVRPRAGTGLRKLADTREQFAPAQFESLDAAAKLSRRSYEPMPSGVSMSPDGALSLAPRMVKRRVRYEEEIIDSNYKRARSRFSLGLTGLFDFFVKGSSVALSGLSAASRAQKRPFTDTITVDAPGYVVARKSDNAPYAAAASFASEAEANDHLRGLSASARAGVHVIPRCEASRAR